MIEPNDIIAYNAYPDIKGVKPIGNFRGASLWDVPEDDSVLFVSVDDTKELFQLLKEPRYVNKKYSLVSCASDFSVVLQEENNLFKDMLARLEHVADFVWNEDRDQVAYPRRSTMTFGYWISDHYKDSCNPYDKYSVKNCFCTYYTFPEIPSNVVRWHQTNLQLEDKCCSPIPFGVSPQDRELIAIIAHETRNQAKHNGVYVNIQPHTIERARILKQLRSNPKINGMTITLRDGGLDKATYLNEIAQHQYVLCWDGMGIDSYRVWETYYLGARPIVSYRMARILNQIGLTHCLWYPETDEFYYNSGNNYEALKMSYWAQEFFNEDKS